MREIKESVANIRKMIREHEMFLSNLSDAITEIEESCEGTDKNTDVYFKSEAAVEDNYYSFHAVYANGKTLITIIDKVEDDVMEIEEEEALINTMAGFAEGLPFKGLEFISEEESRELFLKFLTNIMDKGWI